MRPRVRLPAGGRGSIQGRRGQMLGRRVTRVRLVEGCQRKTERSDGTEKLHQRCVVATIVFELELTKQS